MIYDHRTYICKVGMLNAHVWLYQEVGYAIQKKHLGEPVLWADPECLADVKKSAELGALPTRRTRSRWRRSSGEAYPGSASVTTCRAGE